MIDGPDKKQERKQTTADSYKDIMEIDEAAIDTLYSELEWDT